MGMESSCSSSSIAASSKGLHVPEMVDIWTCPFMGFQKITMVIGGNLVSCLDNSGANEA